MSADCYSDYFHKKRSLDAAKTGIDILWKKTCASLSMQVTPTLMEQPWRANLISLWLVMALLLKVVGYSSSHGYSRSMTNFVWSTTMLNFVLSQLEPFSLSRTSTKSKFFSTVTHKPTTRVRLIVPEQCVSLPRRMTWKYLEPMTKKFFVWKSRCTGCGMLKDIGEWKEISILCTKWMLLWWLEALLLY